LFAVETINVVRAGSGVAGGSGIAQAYAWWAVNSDGRVALLSAHLILAGLLRRFAN